MYILPLWLLAFLCSRAYVLFCFFVFVALTSYKRDDEASDYEVPVTAMVHYTGEVS